LIEYDEEFRVRALGLKGSRFRFYALGVGFWVLGFRFWVLDFRFWILSFRF
jgi:hypothetical protein